MKRPMLISGITVAVVSALLIFFESGAVVIPFVVASVLFLCFLFRKKIKNIVIILTACVVTLITLLSFFAYNKVNISPYLDYHKTTQTITGKVITTPQYVSNYILFTLQSDTIGNTKHSTKIHVVSENRNEQNINLFDYITLSKAYVTLPTNNYSEYNFTELSDSILLTAQSADYEILWQSEKTPYYYCLKLKEGVSQQITSYMSKDNGALLKGMLFGEKSDLDSATSQSFRNCGISHLLAVSGLHTSLWCGLLMALLSVFKLNEKVKAVVCIVFLVLFCTISGFTPSVIRASFMTAAALISPFFKRTPDSINSLGFAVVVLILLNPYILFNISFQLSVLATLGVLVANLLNPRIKKLANKLPVKKLKTFYISLITSLTISAFAGLFTLPACAYYFETFSIVSPVSNILCVQLAFYGMLFGTLSVATSFIKLPFVQSICILLFEITEFLLDLVKELASFISQFKYSTIPVHREYFHIGIMVAFLLLVAGYSVHKKKSNKNTLKLTITACIISLVASILVPIAAPSHRNTITISNCDNGIQLIVRSGLHYAYIENTTSELADSTFNALPKATCESLNFYFSSYLSKASINNVSSINIQYKPSLTIVPSSVYKTAKSNGINVPQNTIIDDNTTFMLSNEITIETVDTNSIKYAIIKGTDKSAFIHLCGDTNAHKYVSTDDFDILVYNGEIPAEIPANAKTAVISIKDYDPVVLNSVENNSTQILTTAKHGSIEIHL